VVASKTCTFTENTLNQKTICILTKDAWKICSISFSLLNIIRPIKYKIDFHKLVYIEDQV
jgi:hypothetical protein